MLLKPDRAGRSGRSDRHPVPTTARLGASGRLKRSTVFSRSEPAINREPERLQESRTVGLKKVKGREMDAGFRDRENVETENNNKEQREIE